MSLSMTRLAKCLGNGYQVDGASARTTMGTGLRKLAHLTELLVIPMILTLLLHAHALTWVNPEEPAAAKVLQTLFTTLPF
jgi:hypothetical protein